jgi:hypothetical protein
MSTQVFATPNVYSEPMCQGHSGLLITIAVRAWVSHPL